MAKLAPTRTTLGENARLVSVGRRNAALVDPMDLSQAVRMAHWTVRGAQLAALHRMFEEFYGQPGTAADDTAERIVQFGGTPSTIQAMAAATRLAPHQAELRDGIGHVAALNERSTALATTTPEAMDAAAEAGDADTADLLIDTSRMLDKALWMLEAHLD